MLFALCSSAVPGKRKQYHTPCKHLVLFFHDIIYNGNNAANATSAIVGAPEGANLTILANQFHFGNIVVFDDPITLDNNLHSKPVGRAQGFYIYNTKNTYTSWLGFTFVLNNTDHDGTITFAGADPIMQKTRDISVTGGTGDFFMHRGIATIMTDAFEERMVMEPATASPWRYRRGSSSFWSKRPSPFGSLGKPRVFSFRYHKGMKSLFFRRRGFFSLSESSVRYGTTTWGACRGRASR
ncbi:hypothetical protein JHK87_020108 [Glycine soja]|nr:hypothetical protein JHK87_020108 [Glycine soja]